MNRDDRFYSCMPLAFRRARRFAKRHAGRMRVTGIEVTDVQQSAMLALHRASLQFKPERGNKFITFADRVIENALHGLAEDRYRDRAMMPAGREDSLGYVADHAPDAADLAEEHERIAAIQEAIRQLFLKQRAAVNRRLQSLGFGDIALAEGITPQSVQFRWSMGVSRLRKHLKGHE